MRSEIHRLLCEQLTVNSPELVYPDWLVGHQNNGHLRREKSPS